MRPSFRTDRPVVAAKQPITGDLRARFERACDDPEPLFAPSRAVYDATATGVRKTYAWGEAVGTLACPAAGQPHDGRLQAVPSPAAARARLAEAFAASPPVSVRRDRTAAADMEETKAQLQALGYF
jgi:arylsulfatase A